jgi:hypothetical protein
MADDHRLVMAMFDGFQHSDDQSEGVQERAGRGSADAILDHEMLSQNPLGPPIWHARAGTPASVVPTLSILEMETTLQIPNAPRRTPARLWHLASSSRNTDGGSQHFLCAREIVKINIRSDLELRFRCPIVQHCTDAPVVTKRCHPFSKLGAETWHRWRLCATLRFAHRQRW